MIFMLPIPADWAADWNAFVNGLGGNIVALVLFVFASLTDYWDGSIARKNNLVSNFGKFLDPIADKLLVISTFACFLVRGKTGVVALVVIVGREFLVTGMRLLAAEKGVVISASLFGKAKTVTQLIALIFLFTEPILGHIFVSADIRNVFSIVGEVLVLIAIAMTIFSGIDYLYKNRRFFRG